MEDTEESFQKALGELHDHYQKQIDDLRDSLKVANWAKEDAQDRLEDPERERRRRVFEDYCISKKLDVAGMCADDWRGVWIDVEKILKEADAFANKGKE